MSVPSDQRDCPVLMYYSGIGSLSGRSPWKDGGGGDCFNWKALPYWTACGHTYFVLFSQTHY